MTDVTNALTNGLDERAAIRASAMRRFLTCAVLVASCISIAACGSTPTTKNKFEPKKYGVKGSPRVVSKGSSVPKGGGRYVVGKPYKIAGKWYRPKVEPNYDKVGLASWYGPTFHGRMTANGEIFDKNALTAAHPTMPLPSYARVTNVKNGRSMIVRVNDRGPFHGNRVIDLSSKVADMLDFKSNGTAKVRVQYVGRARLDGLDHSYLIASYRGPGAVAPGGTRPGTMIAMAPPAGLVGPAPVPRERPLLSSDGSFSVAFDPAQSYESTSKAITVASNSGPYGTRAAFEPRVESGSQTLGYLPASSVGASSATYHPAAYQPTSSYEPARRGILPPVPVSLKNSFAAEKRIDAAYGALAEIGGGVSLARISSSN
ncbi:septal ring lytic transglycosylase RlpA family protein [Breoghania sp.]|uniref:septal ring lytic transglycosylase RlpA family protein n=2 Tax=Breoghania sp. TaxID=2065378 RepID=UPI0037479277